MDKLLKMNYEEIIEYLKQKYGNVPKNYFTINGNKNQGNSRTKDGLVIHHIDEDKMIMLSNKKNEHLIVNKGFVNIDQINIMYNDFQKADRLVYCDLLEHLLLHIKIMEYPKPIINNIAVGIGGILNYIVPELNDIYSGINYTVEWKKKILEKVINGKEEYFLMLKYIIKSKKINIKKELLYSTLIFNQSIWKFENNIELFKEFNQWLLKGN